jgi:hypothetical protein
MNLPHLIHGDIPDWVPLERTDLAKEQLNAIEANRKAFPDIAELGSLWRKYMEDQFNASGFNINKYIEGGGDLVSNMQGVAKDWLGGKLSDEEQGALWRTAAQEGLNTGWMGQGGFATRDIGIATGQRQAQGAQMALQSGNAAQQWAGLASGLIMSPSGMMITPKELADFTMRQRILTQANQQNRANLAAMADPAANAIAGTILNFAGAAMGHMGGGNMMSGAGQIAPGGEAYASAGSPSMVYGESGYPSAIPVNGYQFPSQAPADTSKDMAGGSMFNFMG